MLPSTPVTNGGRISEGNAVAIGRRTVEEAGAEAAGLSKAIFVTASLSNISSVGKRRMIWLHHVRISMISSWSSKRAILLVLIAPVLLLPDWISQ